MQSPQIIPLQHIADERGQLTIVEAFQHCPFHIERVFWIYDVPEGRHRGAHAHEKCHEFIVAINGSFDVEWDNGTNKGRVHLSSPTEGFHIPPGVWATELNYAPGTICLVMASMEYDESEYIREYDDFVAFHNQTEKNKQ